MPSDPLTPERLARLQECFERALELDTGARDAFLHTLQGVFGRVRSFVFVRRS